MSVLNPLPPEDANVIVVLMLKPSHAVDLFIGDLTRKSRSKSGRTASSYRRVLYKFADMLEAGGRQPDVKDITPDDCRRFLDMFLYRVDGRGLTAPNYQALVYSYLNSFLKWLYKQQRIKRNPLDHVERPRRIAPLDLDTVNIDTADVPLLFQACRTPTEHLTIAMLAYLGPRRNAAATRRRKHYNRDAGTLEFLDKGSKTIRKPVPGELRKLIDQAIDDGLIAEPDDYIIPPEGTLTRKGDRDDRVIWRVVTRVAERAGVRCHVHALRAAFATYFLEQGGEMGALQTLMQHDSFATTQVYLKKLDRKAAMEQVRELRWSKIGVVEPDNACDSLSRANPSDVAGVRTQPFADSVGMGAGGFEPPSQETPHG